MPRAPKPKAPAPPGVNLEKLSQADAARLICKPASWLRDNAHLRGRNSDGTYSGPALVAALRTMFEPVELSDDTLEPVLQLAEAIVAVMSPRPVLQVLAQIEALHGAAGLASVGAAIVAQCRIDAARPHARDDERLNVLVCGSCRRFRWGRAWLTGSPPAGYVVLQADSCPSCGDESRMSLHA